MHFREIHEFELQGFVIQAVGPYPWQRNAAKCADSGFIALKYLIAAFAAAGEQQVGKIAEELFQVHFCVILMSEFQPV